MNFNPLYFLAVLLMTLPLIGGCTSKSFNWTEEVQLSDGRTVHVKREDKYRDVTPLGSRGAALVEQASLRVLGDSSSPRWSDRLIPIFLDVDRETREIVLVCTYDASEVWRARGKPNLPYWQFRLRDGKWVEEPVSAFVWGRPTNLILNPYWIENQEDPITLATKQSLRESHVVATSVRSIDPNARNSD